eukprot:1764649-Amphidinium_carterae.1
MQHRGRLANICLERSKVEATGLDRVATKTRTYYVSDSIERCHEPSAEAAPAEAAPATRTVVLEL